MVYDICLKIKDLGDMYGSFVKSTTNSVYLRNAILSKASGSIISFIKIEKKYIVTASRMALPSFECFTDDQLYSIISLNNANYTQAAQKVLEARKKIVTESKSTIKSKTDKQQMQPKNAMQNDKKEWDQFEANKKLFGVEPTFNVDEYACAIDRSAPEYASSYAHAEKIAKEIEKEPILKNKKSEAMNDDTLYSTVKDTDKWKEVEETTSSKLAKLKKNLEEIQNQFQNAQDKTNGTSWIDITKFLTKKKTLINEIEALTNPQPKAQESLPVSSSPTKQNKPTEKVNKIDKNEIEQPKPQKIKEHSSGTKKQQRHVNLEIPAKFNSASEIFEFISKNLAAAKHKDFKSVWCDNTNQEEDTSLHLKPLESFDFPSEKIHDIEKYILSRKPLSSKRF
jgi:PAB1-binding protein PBP1